MRPARIGFAEIEIFSGYHNVALGKAISGNVQQGTEFRLFSALTDGRNFYGNILPLRDWLNQLARRHDLERERPLVTAELKRRYARQKENLRWMSWMAALLAAGILITILVDRLLRMRQIAKIRERFAADLHDELGANLHAIGMLSALAQDTKSSEELLELFDRSRAFSKRSITAVRYCTDMLEARSLCENLAEDMKRSADRLLTDMEYKLSFEGENLLPKIPPRKRADLFFFYKECLANIIRHSGATEADTHLKVALNNVTLIITDNGIGLPDGIPASLKRRARILSGKLSVDRPQEGGTRIILNLKLRKWRLRK